MKAVDNAGGEFKLVRCDALGRPVDAVQALGASLEEACRASADLYSRIGYAPPWVSYVSLAGGVPVGGGAFVGAPKEGRAEIAYFTLPEHERRGYATSTAKCLVAIGRSEAPGIVLFAKTLPESNASTRILEKIGFGLAGNTTDDEIGTAWLWELPPD